MRTMIFGGITGNAYLLRTEGGFVMVDTARAKQRDQIDAVLEEAGCAPGELRLIVITHGDFDHTGNALHLRRQYGAEIAMHPADFAMVETGDMFCSRSRVNPVARWFVNSMFLIEQFTPDMALNEGALDAFGLTVLHLPGHTPGSIGLLTAEGDLFCGDLLENVKTPRLGSMIDDAEAAKASVARLKALPIRTVYPGHGRPFAMAELKGA